ncbi:MAG TPA: EamA family transporter [Verrucomicrobiales bacterium]|mgnify:CR=1 FL=1|nr:EamA family transporter [Verrucomicrobiales bacterium]
MSIFSTPGGRGGLALAAGAAGIGFAPLFVRWSELGPFSTGAYRMLIAAPLLWAWARWEARTTGGLPVAGTPGLPASPAGPGPIVLILLAGFFFAGDMALWNWSLHLTTVANSTLITNLTPLLVMVAGRLLFGERITRAYLAGMPVAFLGVGLLVRSSGPGAADHWKGDLVSAAATFFYAGYLLSLRRLRMRHGSAWILFWSGLVSAAILFPVAWAAGDRLLPATPAGWGTLLALAAVSHFGGQGLIAYGFGHATAAVGSLVLLVQPVVAALLAWGFLGESLTWVQLLGGALALAGVTIASRR